MGSDKVFIKPHHKRAFTIIELIIVIAVIAVLAAVLIPTFVFLGKAAEEKRMISDARNTYLQYVVENGGQGEDYMIYESDGRYIAIVHGEVTKIYDDKDNLAKDIFDNEETIEDESEGYVNIRTNFNKKLFTLYEPNNPNIPSLAKAPSEEDTGLSFARNKIIEISQPLNEEVKTFEAWIKLPNGYTPRAGVIFGNYGVSGHDYFSFEIYNSGAPRLNVSTEGGGYGVIFNGINVADGNWNHVAISFDSSTRSTRCYINGVYKQTKTMPNCSLGGYNYVAAIGGDYRFSSDLNNYNNTYFQGSIHSVSVYNNLRSEEQIASDMIVNGTVGLIATWQLPNEPYVKAIKDVIHERCDAYMGKTFTSSRDLVLPRRLSEQAYTYEAWINLPKYYATASTANQSNRGGVIFGNYNGSSNYFSFEIQFNGKPRLCTNNTSGGIFNTSVATGEWVHVAIVYDPSIAKAICYVNGVQIGQLAFNAYTASAFNNTPMIGGDFRSGNNIYFKGKIRSVAVYSSVKTVEEIQQDMEEISKENLIAGWDLTNGETNNSYLDLSGNEYTARAA